MQHYQYLLLMLGCLVITLPLELVLGARVYARWRLAVLALVYRAAVQRVGRDRHRAPALDVQPRTSSPACTWA